MKKFVAIVLAALLFIALFPILARAASSSPSSGDPNRILTDPNFNLNENVDPEDLEEWYHSAVTITDTNLKKALQKELGVNGDVTVQDMFRLSGSLNLSGLSIADLTGLEYAINVKQLYLNNNGIMSLEALKNLYNLEELSYSRNKVRVVPAWIFSARKLKVVNGGDNGSTTVGTPTADSVLTELYLEGNQLSSLPDLSKLQSLKTISLSYNNFTEFPATVLTLTKLEMLSVTHNKIRLLPDMSALANLTTLSVDHNQLEQFPGGVELLAKLQQLSLSNNQITEIPDALADSGSLENLLLGMNEITNIPDGLVSMQNLKVLDLSLNRINLADNAEKIKALEDKLSTFFCKLQKPTFVVELYQQKDAPKGKLVWRGIDNVSVPQEGSITITKFVVERIEEEDTESNDDYNSTRPTLKTYVLIAELGPDVREYVDHTADPDKEYTYRVTAYITGTQMEDIEFNAEGFATVSTKDIIKDAAKSKMLYFIIIGVAVLALAGGIVAYILMSGKKKKKGSARKSDSNKQPHKKIKKIKRIDKHSHDDGHEDGTDDEKEPVTIVVSDSEILDQLLKDEEQDG